MKESGKFPPRRRQLTARGEGQGRHLVALRRTAPGWSRTWWPRTDTGKSGPSPAYTTKHSPGQRVGPSKQYVHTHTYTQNIHAHTCTHTERNAPLHTHTSTHSHVLSHSHVNTHDPACGSGRGARRLLVGTQPSWPTGSTQTAGKRRSTHPTRCTPRPHPPACRCGLGRAQPPPRQAWTGASMESQPSLAMERGEEGQGGCITTGTSRAALGQHH